MLKDAISNCVKESVEFVKWGYRYLHDPKHKPYCNEGEKIVAVGNGPSAKDFPYHRFKKQGYKFCCVNFFALDETRFFDIKPEFYCCVDPGFCEEGFEKTPHGAKLISALERVDWDMTFICYKGKRLPVKNDRLQFQYLNRNAYEGEINSLRNALYNRNIAHCGFQNVMVAVIYYFVMSKAAHVVLTGVENNWHRELYVGMDNDVYRDDTHFYGIEKLNLTQRGEIGKGELYKYFYFYYITMYEYYVLSGYAKKNGVPVENACADSFIDVFSKIEI